MNDTTKVIRNSVQIIAGIVAHEQEIKSKDKTLWAAKEMSLQEAGDN